MSRNNDYKKNKVVDATRLLPHYIKTDILEGISDNIFNRFLTKKDFEKVNGYVGKETDRSILNKIPEEREFLDQNQLQPVIENNVGTEKDFLTFEQFLRLLEESGVDLENFDKWGELLQFNFYPPIDIDKLINYQNYYWTDRNTTPEYVTIKNQENRAQARYEELKSSTFSRLNGIKSSTDSQTIINDEEDGLFIVFDITENERYLVRKSGSNLTKQEDGSSFSLTTIFEYAALTYPISNISSNSVRVSGNFLENITKGFIISLYDTEQGEQEIATVSNVSYDNTSDIVEIEFEKPLVSTSHSILSLHPVIATELKEYEYFKDIDDTKIIDEISVFDLGESIWYKKKEVLSNKDAENDLYSIWIEDPDVNFNTAIPTFNRVYKLQITSGVNRGLYDIHGFGTNIIYLHTRLLSSSYQEYNIYVDNDIFSNTDPIEFDFWYDEVNDILKQYVSGTWVNKILNFSKLYGTINDIEYDTENDWSISNKWVHKNQLNSLSQARQADIPIIEYQTYLELSEFSTFSYKWQYSGNIEQEYVDVTNDPNLFELKPVEVDSSAQVEYIDAHTIRLPEQNGNLVPHININDKIVFSGFDFNDGTYTVADIKYIQPGTGQRYVTEIELIEPFSSTLDSPTGAMIYPNNTSLGDTFDPNYEHWIFNGVENIEASSIESEKNPMLDTQLIGYDGQSATGEEYETNLGLYFQEFKFKNTYSGPRIDLSHSLHDLCLIEDYQEGDLRLYINGKRIYSKFEEGSVNNKYVTHIVLDDSVEIGPDDKIRIELGEYFKEDIGKRDVSVLTDYTMGPDDQIEQYNLSSNRKTEQIKSGINQYPLFKLYDIYGNGLKTSNSIFWFKEDKSQPINNHIFKRIATKRNPTDYVFEHGLMEDNGRLLCYKDRTDDTVKSIWRRGNNNEIDRPHKIDGDWDITNSWYYNIEHDLRKDNSLVDLFRHFKTMQLSQDDPNLFGLPENNFHAIENPNLGLGGTIKEHNGNLDLLVSMFISRAIDVNKVIEFAGEQYSRFLFYLENYYLDNVGGFLDSSITSDAVIKAIENDSRFDRLFGDSTSYFNGTGIRGVIATSSILKFNDYYKPEAYKVLDNWHVLHHDGHRTRINIDSANKLVAFKKLTNNIQMVNDSIDQFPDVNDYSEGDYLIRGNKIEKTIDLYRLSSSQWERVDVEGDIASLILDIETKLYETSVEVSKSIEQQYKLEWVESESNYTELEKESFLNYHQNFSPFENDIFDSSDPFTWNYAYTKIADNPVVGETDINSLGSWQALYEKLYQTPHPHKEPWRLQGYNNKPEWWDSEYAENDSNTLWIWKRNMWTNILSGIVPSGKELYNGNISSGNFNEAKYSYSFLPVNITTTTSGDVEPDDIIPPYWDGSLSSDSGFKPLYDKSNQEFIRTPSANFLYGQMGHNEWKWKSSINFIHSKINIAFKLDPINFFSKAYGDQLHSVDCLLVDKKSEKVKSHTETLFHGDITDDNEHYISHGLQQWIVHYNRYNSLDGGSSNYRSAWRNWEPRLSYLFESFINDTTLRVDGDTIDITGRDYDIDILKDNTQQDELFSALKTTIRKIPSRFTSDVHSTKNWVFDVIPETPDKIKKIKAYHPQNYEFRQISNTDFVISSYELDNVDIDRPRGYWKATYHNTLSLDTVSNLNVDTTYNTTIEIDGSDTTNISITGSSSNPPTVKEIIDEVNSQIAGAVVSLDAGSIIITSVNTNVSISEVDVLSDNMFSTISTGMSVDSGLTEWNFNNIFYISGNQFKYFANNDEIEIQNSTNYNGSYTVESVFFDIETNQTIIKVEEDVTINNDTVDGIIIPSNSITIPWETGQEVYIDTDGTLPTGLKIHKPYFVIKLDDYTFQLAASKNDAINGKDIEFSVNGVGSHWVGNLLRTFKPLGGNPDHSFNRYEPDTRTVREYTGIISLSRIQSLVDYVMGYNDYLEDMGILSENDRMDNVDKDTGRANSWELELEKFISWINELLLNKFQTLPEIEVEVNVSNNSFVPQSEIIFVNGERVTVEVDPNAGTIPSALVSPFNSFIPYYVIRNNNGDIQLAYTKQDAESGREIRFNDGNGIIKIKSFKKNRKYPNRTLNPYKIQFTTKHERGLLETYTNIDSRVNVFEKQSLYDSNLQTIPPNEVLFYRKDKKSKVMLTEESTKKIYGGKVSFVEVSHICHFNSYTSDDKLIFDSYLGINTPRVYLEYLRPTESTGRPSVGGLVLNNSSLIDSIEKSIEDIRYYYDPYKAIESDTTAKQAKKSVGYQGPKDYMLDLGINEKSQFIYWKSFVQNKGTNKSLLAFTNQKQLENVSVDEFWAYRLCSFGDASRKAYPEIKLYTDDVVKKELRLEFTAPSSGVLGKEHTKITLTDTDRWNNLPDVLRLMDPYDAYFFDTKITGVYENVENQLTEFYFQPDTAYKGFLLPNPAYGVVVTYKKGNETLVAREDLDYRIVNSRVVEFIAHDFMQWYDVKIASLSYAYNEQNPFRLIETKRPEKVISDIPIWNPAFGEHNPLGEYPVDIEKADDPAMYTDDLDDNRTSSNHWNETEVGTVWADISRRYYKPYYDKKIFPDEYDRSLKWGTLEDFGDVTFYKWVKTILSPEEYIEKVSDDENLDIMLSEKITGTPRRIVYKNIGTESDPVWQEEKVKVSNFPVAAVSTPDLLGFDYGDTIDIYVNGKLFKSITHISRVFIISTLAEAEALGNIQRKDMITLVEEPHEPTEQELENNEYRIVYPHTKVRKYNNERMAEETVYYYWVSDMKSEKLLKNQSLTLLDAEKEYKEMNAPHAIIDGFMADTVGYGVLFGSTYDPEDYGLPTRYTQCTIKGLENTVKDNTNYLLRLVKDFTLRDRYNDDNLSLQNKHWSWKLIRKNSPGKIDRLLWKKVIEAATERKVIDDDFNIDLDSLLPDESRTRYDALVENASTRIGLYNGRVMMDKQTILDLTFEILLDPNREWKRVDIEDFIDQYDFTRRRGIKDFYAYIYNSFSEEEINDIYFELLEKSVSLNYKHPDFFKTSWVSIDVSNRIENTNDVGLDIVDVYPSEFECADENIDTSPSPTPSPSSVTPTPTPSSVTPTPTPSISSTPTPTPTPSASADELSGAYTVFVNWEN
jgi:hypothetical protein